MPRLDLAPLFQTFVIRDKRARLVPLEPNWCQQQILDRYYDDYANGRPARYIILKARQLGISTIIESILFSMGVVFANTNSVVVAHRSDSSEELFGITKRIYEHWPLRGKFRAKYSTRRELVLLHQNSSVRVMTADKPDTGRGRTLSHLHASEIAFWRLPTETMVGFNQSIPNIPGTSVFLESTANGLGNFFEDTWTEAVEGRSEYVPFFFPWFTHHEYIPCFGIGCRDGSCKECQKKIKGLKPQGDEKELVRLGASPAHLAWKRWAVPNLCFGDGDFFAQEYPATPEMAFIAKGVNAFNPQLLREVYDPTPFEQGRLEKGKDLGDVKFVKDPKGPLRIFKKPSRDTSKGQYFLGADPCQPGGTLVRKVVRGHKSSGPVLTEDVPIEDIRAGDRVVSLNANSRSIYRMGRKVTSAGERPFSGFLVTVATDRGRRSSYTPEHRCVVRLNGPLKDGNHVVYLQRRGDDYRIGRTMWRMEAAAKVPGIHRRAMRQGADAAWVLEVHDNQEDAALAEAVLSVQYGIPTWQFCLEEDANWRPAMPLTRFWEKVGGNREPAERCLRDCGRDIRFPFWERGKFPRIQDIAVVRACNLLSGMEVLEPDEVQPRTNGFLLARRGCGGWSPVTVTRSWYEGPVYSLDVENDHTYVADGIVTHNCHGISDGDFAAIQVINRHTKEQVAVWHGRINPIPFAEEIAKLGAFYNMAIVSPDVMGGGAATLGALTYIYPRIWQHRYPDKWPGENQGRALGFLASWQRKQWMVAQLADYVERGQITIHCQKTYNEMRGYVFYGDKGYGEQYGPGSAGGHDDLVSALAICVLCESTEDPIDPLERERPTFTQDGKLYAPPLPPDDREEVEVW